MKKFEILREFPKCDRETRSEPMLLKNGSNRLAPQRSAQTFNLCKKKKKCIICETQ